MELFDARKYSGKRVCVALSGGVDSVCLLHAFKVQAADMGITLSAVHIEHGIRGEESVRDMRFCEELCKSMGIPLRIERLKVPAAAKERGSGLEETARALRYGVFCSLLEEGKADLVATAHHLDDVAETVLFRLARGTGTSGMRAVTEQRGIVRPLLNVTRAEIEAYASLHSLPHVEDSTNRDEAYARNYIRHTVLPAFEKIHGNAAKHLVEFASLAAKESEYLDGLAQDAILRVTGEEMVPVGLDDVLFFRAAALCIKEGTADYARADLEEVAKLRFSQTGKKVRITSGKAPLTAVREGDYLVFYREEAPFEGELPFGEGHYSLPAPFSVEACAAPDFQKPQRPRVLYADLDAFPAGCVVRTRRTGDMITPYHAPRTTLKKFLTDRKISARLGRRLPIVAKESEVYAVVGVEISDLVKITDGTVKTAVIR